MKLKIFASNLGLPRSNPWRKIFQKGRKLRDPRWQNILLVAGTLSVLGGFAIGRLLFREFEFYGGSLPSQQMSLRHMFLFFSPICLLIGGAMMLGMSGYEMRLEETTAKLAREWGLSIESICSASESQLRSVAKNNLMYLGNEILKQERLGSDPFSQEREAKKNKFRQAYDFMLDVGLIEDVGYGRFIRNQHE